MTPSQLRQWSFQNSQPDQWWINLDAVTEEIPVTVAEIEERIKSGDYSAVQALHVSQAGLENAPWVEVAMPAAFTAPMTPPIAPNSEFQASGVTSAKGKFKPTANVENSSLGEIASIFGVVFAVALILFVLRNMPYLMIFLLTWGIMIAVFRKASGVIAVGGGLIVAAITLLFAAKTFPDLGSDAGRASARQGVIQRDAAESASDVWYAGGTLTHAKMSEWNRATYANRLATSADFVARSIGGNLGDLDMDDDIKPMAMRLELEISAAYKEGVTDNTPVPEIAAAIVIILKGGGQWLR